MTIATVRRHVTRAALSAFAGAALLGVAWAQPAGAAEYTVDPTHTFVQFKIKHLGYSWMVGTFDKVEGAFTYDPAAGPAAQKIKVVIDTASIDTSHAERDKHLRSDDFLDVEAYPTATFVSTGYEGDETGGVMKGDLTLHGVTKPVEIAVKKVGEGKDPWGGYRAGFEGSLSIKRSDFGMGYNLGPASESLDLFLSIEGIRQ